MKAQTIIPRLCTVFLMLLSIISFVRSDPMYCIGSPLGNTPDLPSDFWTVIQAACRSAQNYKNQGQDTETPPQLKGFFYSHGGYAVRAYESVLGLTKCSDRFGRGGKPGGDLSNIIKNCNGNQGAFNHQSQTGPFQPFVNNGLTFLYYDPIGINGQLPAK